MNLKVQGLAASSFVQEYDARAETAGLKYTRERTSIAVVGVRQELAAHGAALVSMDRWLGLIFIVCVVIAVELAVLIIRGWPA